MKNVRHWPCSPSVDSQTHENSHTKLEEKDEEKHEEVEWAITPTKNKTTINIFSQLQYKEFTAYIEYLFNYIFSCHYYSFNYYHLLDSYVDFPF